MSLMGKLLLVLAIVAAIFLLLKSLRRTPPPLTKATTEDMLRCKQCGIHIPSSEAVQANGESFCGAAHRDAYKV
jgi:uncharacterized protein